MKLRTEAGEDAISSPWKGEVGAKRRVGVIEASRFDRTPAKTAHARSGSMTLLLAYGSNGGGPPAACTVLQ